MKQLLLTVLTALALTSEAATNAVRVEFPLESFFDGGKYVKGIKLQAVNSILGDGATWYAGSTLSVLPQGGTNPIVSLAPNDYWLTFGDITNRLRLMVPYSTGLLNAVDLVTNGVSLYYPLTITANGLTNGQTNVTLSGTFSGDGSGLTGTGISSNTVQGMIDTGTQGATNPVPGWITAATASLLATNGNGGQLTNLNPNAITNAPWLSSTSNAWTGAFTGNGSGLTNLPVTGVFPDAFQITGANNGQSRWLVGFDSGYQKEIVTHEPGGEGLTLRLSVQTAPFTEPDAYTVFQSTLPSGDPNTAGSTFVRDPTGTTSLVVSNGYISVDQGTFTGNGRGLTNFGTVAPTNLSVTMTPGSSVKFGTNLSSPGLFINSSNQVGIGKVPNQASSSYLLDVAGGGMFTGVLYSPYLYAGTVLYLGSSIASPSWQGSAASGSATLTVTNRITLTNGMVEIYPRTNAANTFGIFNTNMVRVVDVSSDVVRIGGALIASTLTLTNTAGSNYFAGTLTVGRSAFMPTNTAAFGTLTNPVTSGATWTNLTGARGLLSLNGTLSGSAVSGFPGLCITNLSNGEWVLWTNSFVLTAIDTRRATLAVGPNERVIVTNASSGSASATLDASWFRTQ